MFTGEAGTTSSPWSIQQHLYDTNPMPGIAGTMRDLYDIGLTQQHVNEFSGSPGWAQQHVNEFSGSPRDLFGMPMNLLRRRSQIDPLQRRLQPLEPHFPRARAAPIPVPLPRAGNDIISASVVPENFDSYMTPEYQEMLAMRNIEDPNWRRTHAQQVLSGAMASDPSWMAPAPAVYDPASSG